MLARRVPAYAVLLALVSAVPAARAGDDAIPPVDRRVQVRDLNTPCVFSPSRDKDAWLARARSLREQILVSAGLMPLPERCPLRAKVFGRLERADHSVEKVYFESYPGFYVTGNLYRPRGRTGPFPGVLSPHGHWKYGRLENSAVGSIPARCISLARQGYVVFSYDMVGYNDSRQVDHRLLDPRLSQWGIGSLSLHLWNSIRSLDFLESLPEVDRTRLACTGASGGATQTFLLAAVDDRVRVSAPVNMISHTMQGGDVCENAPILRLDTNNMEIGALMAPRAMLMVSATGDWTQDTPRVEFPAVRSVYELLGAKDAVDTVQFTAEHNYNQDSREAMYGWFGRFLLSESEPSRLREREYDPGQPSELLVFFGRELPREAKTQQQIVDALVESARAQLAGLLPRDAAGLRRFREVMGPVYRHTLAAAVPGDGELLEATAPGSGRRAGPGDLVIGRRGRGDRVPVRFWTPTARAIDRATLVVDPDGIAGAARNAAGLVRTLRGHGQLVATLDAFNTGGALARRDTSDRFFTTYNRTDDANRVQDVVTALAWLRHRRGVRRVGLVGLGRAGLWCLLAAGLVPDLEAVVADADRFPTAGDDSYLGPISIPLFRRAGGFETALLLALGTRLRVHDTGGVFETSPVEESARVAAAPGRLVVSTSKLAEAEMAAWLNGSGRRIPPGTGRKGPGSPE